MRTRAPGTVTSPEFALGPAAHHSPGVHAALSVLEALIVAESLSLSELATQLGIPKSSLLRVCSVLTHRGWVTRARDGRYSLGVRAIGLSAHATEYPLVRAFRAVAPELLTRHNETVCLAVLDGDESTFIALEETSHPVRLVTNIGDRTAAFASPSGQVILADRARQVVAAEYAGRSLVTPTGRRGAPRDPRGGAPQRMGGEPRRDRPRPLLHRRPDPERRQRRPGRPHHVRAHGQDEHAPPGADPERPGRRRPTALGRRRLAAGLERHPRRAQPRPRRPLPAAGRELKGGSSTPGTCGRCSGGEPVAGAALERDPATTMLGEARGPRT